MQDSHNFCRGDDGWYRSGSFVNPHFFLDMHSIVLLNGLTFRCSGDSWNVFCSCSGGHRFSFLQVWVTHKSVSESKSFLCIRACLTNSLTCRVWLIYYSLFTVLWCICSFQNPTKLTTACTCVYRYAHMHTVNTGTTIYKNFWIITLYLFGMADI